MFCTLSGQRAVHPALSPKSGHIFELSTLQAHVREQGTDPVSGQGLALDEIIEVSANPILPKAPSLAGIPSLLANLQSEYDGVVLEAHELRTQLLETRKQLSAALYRNDAALRVITRLTKERDEARQALVDVSAGPPKLSESLANLVGRVRTPESMVPPDGGAGLLQASTNGFEVFRSKVAKGKTVLSQDRAVANKDKSKAEFTPTIEAPVAGFKIQISGQEGLISRPDSSDYIYVPTGNIIKSFPPSRGLFGPRGPVFYDDTRMSYANRTLQWDQAGIPQGGVTSIKFHPVGYFILATAAGFTILNAVQLEVVGEIPLSVPPLTFTIHPDGDLIVYSDTHSIHFYSILDAKEVLTLPGPTNEIAISNNGYIVAYVRGETLHIKDLRTDNPPDEYPYSAASYEHLEFDETGTYLALLSPHKQTITVWHYKKKNMTIVEQQELKAVDIAWAGTRVLSVSDSL